MRRAVGLGLGLIGAAAIVTALVLDRVAPESPAGDRAPVCETRHGLPSVRPDNCVVRVSGGRFTMGAQHKDPKAPAYDPDAGDDEAPPHPVKVDSFFVLLTEVTTAQYERCLKAGACKEKDVLAIGGTFNAHQNGRFAHPVNGVSWFGARDYCAWLGGRLPTEAEWEYAARGDDGRRYPWGDDAATCDYAHMGRVGDQGGCAEGGTQEVWMLPRKGRPQNGLLGLAGNVWEWTADWYDEGYYAKSPVENPRGPETGTRRVQRGGSFSSRSPAELRSAYRAALEPDLRLDDLGFRCVFVARALP